MKNIKILGALTVAGVVAMTGSAFTAGNTVAQDKRFGFGETSVTGVVTTAMVFGQPAGDASEVTSVTYTLASSETVTDATADAAIKYGTSAQDAQLTLTSQACAINEVLEGDDTITCTLPADTAVSAMEVVQLVVTPAAGTTGYQQA